MKLMGQFMAIAPAPFPLFFSDMWGLRGRRGSRGRGGRSGGRRRKGKAGGEGEGQRLKGTMRKTIKQFKKKEKKKILKKSSK